jgi:ubiquinol-cytochrome c reductase cytochrome b subunit
LIHDAFYKIFNGQNTKVVPKNIADYLSPLALAVWIMDDGTCQGSGVIISTNSFPKEEVQFLCDVLKKK